MISHPESGTGGGARAVEFHLAPSRSTLARRIVSAQLRYWQLPHLVDAAAVRVDELLADVRRHTGDDQRCTVRVVLLWDRLSLAAHDRGGLPAQAAGEGQPSDGPHLAATVAAVRDSAGVHAHQDERGRTAWCTLPVPYPTPPPEARRAGHHPWAAHA